MFACSARLPRHPLRCTLRRFLQLLHDKKVKRIILLSDGRTAIVEVGRGSVVMRPTGCCCWLLLLPLLLLCWLLLLLLPLLRMALLLLLVCSLAVPEACLPPMAKQLQIPVENTESDFETVTYDRRNVQ